METEFVSQINNYFDYENYTISLYDFKHNDIFNIKYYEESETIYIKRLDSNEGWGANLMLNIFDKINSKHFTIHIGSSSINEIYRKINLIDRKVYVVLTTIPSRIKLPEFFYNIQHLQKFYSDFIEKGTAHFGSGWLWIYLNDNNMLDIITTHDAIVPINIKFFICIDLWEHAYYIDYEYKRKEYLQNIFKLINWNIVVNNL
jgi:DNA-directed RNA polymerase beta' subunit